jgi:hypothetical protein
MKKQKKKDNVIKKYSTVAEASKGLSAGTYRGTLKSTNVLKEYSTVAEASKGLSAGTYRGTLKPANE